MRCWPDRWVCVLVKHSFFFIKIIRNHSFVVTTLTFDTSEWKTIRWRFFGVQRFEILLGVELSEELNDLI